jgi:hypothetical protein
MTGSLGDGNPGGPGIIGIGIGIGPGNPGGKRPGGNPGGSPLGNPGIGNGLSSLSLDGGGGKKGGSGSSGPPGGPGNFTSRGIRQCIGKFCGKNWMLVGHGGRSGSLPLLCAKIMEMIITLK